MKINKKIILTGLSALFAAGAFVVDMLTEKNDRDEIIKEAAAEAVKIINKK